MGKGGYEGDKQYSPVSAWGYVGYAILFSIPFIGLILLICFSLCDRNINRRNYARSFFCVIILILFFYCGVLFLNTLPSASLSTLRNSIAYQKVRGVVIQISEAVEDQFGFKLRSPLYAPAPTAEPPSTENDYSGITPDFKQAMDSYEEAVDEYIAFVQKMDRNSSDPTALLNYSNMLTKYTVALESLEAVDEKELSDADNLYYVEVSTRIYNKLMKANMK